MTERFEKEKFNYHGGYLTYNGEFVARFKYRGLALTKAQFQRMLIKHYTPEEYFARLKDRESPLGIFEQDGIYRLDMNAHQVWLDGKIIKTWV